MKIKVMRSAFQDALKQVQAIVPTKAAMQILLNVKMTAKDGGQMRLMASDLDVTESMSVPCEILEPGETTLPVKILFAAVQKLPEGAVEIEVDANDHAVVTAGSAVFRMTGYSANDYPALPNEEAEFVCKVPAKVLADMFRKTSFAVSTDSTRRTLSQLNLTVEDGKITAVATDGRRLSMCDFMLDGQETKGKTEILIPQKTVKAIQSAPHGDDADISVHRVGTQFLFRIGEVVDIYTKTYSEAYPNYRQVIPDLSADYTKIPVDRAQFLQIVDRVSIMATGETDRLEIKVCPNEMIVTCRANESEGEARDAMPIKYDGAPVTICFNPDYVVNGIRVCDDDEVVLNVRNGTTPMVVTGSTPWMYVLMPLRVN